MLSLSQTPGFMQEVTPMATPLPAPTAYANYKSYALRYDLSAHTFSCTYAGRGAVVEDAGITGVYLQGVKVFDLGDYRKSYFRWWEEMDSARLSIYYEDGPAEQPSLSLNFCLDLQGIRLKMECRGDLDFRFDGRLHWGADMSRDTFAVCLDRAGQDLRSALGPATSTVDNALFRPRKRMPPWSSSAVRRSGCASTGRTWLTVSPSAPRAMIMSAASPCASGPGSMNRNSASAIGRSTSITPSRPHRPAG
jgi:hypothetical protein